MTLVWYVIDVLLFLWSFCPLLETAFVTYWGSWSTFPFNWISWWIDHRHFFPFIHHHFSHLYTGELTWHKQSIRKSTGCSSINLARKPLGSLMICGLLSFKSTVWLSINPHQNHWDRSQSVRRIGSTFHFLPGCRPHRQHERWTTIRCHQQNHASSFGSSTPLSRISSATMTLLLLLLWFNLSLGKK